MNARRCCPGASGHCRRTGTLDSRSAGRTAIRGGRRCLGKVLLALGVLALPASETLGAEPVSRDQAAATIEQARRDAAEIERRYEDARRDCERGVLVNPCLERVDRHRDQEMRAVREREVEARDALRRLDAEQRAKEREARSAAKVPEGAASKGSGPAGADAATSSRTAPALPPPRSTRAPQDDAAAQTKREDAERRRAEAQHRAEERAADQDRRAAERAEKAARAPAEAERYEQRQRAAQARAEEKARAAEESRQRREQRDRERGEGRK